MDRRVARHDDNASRAQVDRGSLTSALAYNVANAEADEDQMLGAAVWK
jgi:hypothetical protein